MTPTISQDPNRINRLRNLQILNTEIEDDFNSITEIASYICNVPIALITLVDKDKQWFKAAKGVGELKETPIDISFCKHTINADSGELQVKDLSVDERFVNNPFVVGAPHVKFYSGISIVTTDGFRLGTVCVFDNKARELNESQINCLRLLADYTIKLIELKNTNSNLKQNKKALIDANDDLKQYAYAVAHDIKGPLRTMSIFSKFLITEAKDKLNKKEKEYIHYITKSAFELSKYTKSLLEFSESTQADISVAKAVDINDLIDSLNELINKDKSVTILTDKNLPTVFISEIGLRLILQNLLSNSIRYRKKNNPNPYIIIMASSLEDVYEFKVIDNGIGIPIKKLEKIFDIFNKHKDFKESSGIGLSVVKRIVKKMNGKIEISSVEGQGTEVKFIIPKILKAI
jgi:signal transduction histidine kinase